MSAHGKTQRGNIPHVYEYLIVIAYKNNQISPCTVEMTLLALLVGCETHTRAADRDNRGTRPRYLTRVWYAAESEVIIVTAFVSDAGFSMVKTPSLSAKKTE